MAKGYWIPHIDVSDPESYKAYMAATPEAHRKYDGHVLVRGGACEVVEGKGRARVRQFVHVVEGVLGVRHRHLLRKHQRAAAHRQHLA